MAESAQNYGFCWHPQLHIRHFAKVQAHLHIEEKSDAGRYVYMSEAQDYSMKKAI